MNVDTALATTGAATAGAAATPARSPQMQDEFLRLLVAQLEHQNPLDPQDGAAFVAQLAQFAQVEQGAETNQRLAGIEAEQAAAAGAGLAGFVGSAATVRADTIEFDPNAGATPELFVDLDGPAQSVTVTVFDEGGNPVRTMSLGAQSGPEVDLHWDGTDDRGVALARGRYRIEVTAEGADGSSIDAQPRARGVIGAVEFGGGAYRLRMGSIAILPGDVLSIGPKPTETP